MGRLKERESCSNRQGRMEGEKREEGKKEEGKEEEKQEEWKEIFLIS